MIPFDFGVPQGSKLASDMFLLYVNDIKRCLDHCDIKLFADDTLLFVADTDIETAVEKINHDLVNVNNWMCANHLKLNIEKTKCMVISNYSNNNNLDVRIGNEKIEIVKSIKYLGVMIDYNLKLKSHVDFVSKKAAKKIGFLARISKNLNFEDKITIYKTIIAPHFDYCATLLSSCNQNELSRMQKLQNWAMKIVLRARKRTKIADMLAALNWLSVKQRIWYQTLFFIFKLKHGMLPKYLDKYTTHTFDRHQYQLRNRNDFNVGRTNKKSTKNSIFYKGFTQFNSLPDDVKNEERVNTFKSKLSIYVKSHF